MKDVGPCIFIYHAFPIKNVRLVSYFEKPFLENSLELTLIFVLF